MHFLSANEHWTVSHSKCFDCGRCNLEEEKANSYNIVLHSISLRVVVPPCCIVKSHPDQSLVTRPSVYTMRSSDLLLTQVFCTSPTILTMGSKCSAFCTATSTDISAGSWTSEVSCEAQSETVSIKTPSSKTANFTGTIVLGEKGQHWFQKYLAPLGTCTFGNWSSHPTFL